ncbi:MAG TPA: hypothetical protein VGU69_09345 [Rhizomicrobium sp.]|nr:hypothetical protein [Rhizomicrobium sp.]
MNSEHFTRVFDAGAAGFKDWGFAAFGLIFVAIGLIVFFFPRLIRATGIPFLDFGSWRLKFFRYFFLGFALLWTAVSFAATFGSYWHHQSLLRENRCDVVEGPVTNFVPMPLAGHAEESFSVAGVGFSYSDYIVTDAFNNSASHGGPIRAGQIVRICYDPSSHEILRLDIKDFRGNIPDDGISTGLSSSQLQPPPAVLTPWYGSLFVYLYILDYAGLLSLYRPYLRTFFTLRKGTATAAVNPQRLGKQGMMRLLNTLIRADDGGEAIWLRPRGFNVFQMPLLVAKLNIDLPTSSVTSFEIRFSSLFPLTMITFFSGAYLMLTRSMPANAPPVGVLLGIFALLVLGAFAFRMRMFLKRMEVLVVNALPELKDAP